MSQRRLRGVQSCHHAGQLHRTILIRHLDNAARRHLAIVGFHHDVVPISEGGDLCEMGDDHDLTVLGEPGKPSSHLDGDLAANPGVNLVEYQRDGFVTGCEHDLQRQSDAGQLATRRHPAEAAELAAGIGSKVSSTWSAPDGPSSAFVTSKLSRACGIARAASSLSTNSLNLPDASWRALLI